MNKQGQIDTIVGKGTVINGDIKVSGSTKIDGKVISDYVEPEDVNFAAWPGRKLSSGTFAIQGHDPKV